MTANITTRVQAASAALLNLTPTAGPDQVRDALAARGIDPDQWLGAGAARHTPGDPHQARLVAAARVLTVPAPIRSRAVVAFLAADACLPEQARMFPPVPDRAGHGVQLALV